MYKDHPLAYLPSYGTEDSACFDLYASLVDGTVVQVFSYDNPSTSPTLREVKHRSLAIHPGDRMLVPTNLILDIPKGFSVKAHPRSGLSLKQGLTLFNCTGVIDSDYVDPLFITLVNISGTTRTICDGDRIIQAELQVKIDTALESTNKRPTKKTDRNGGFGSTGVNS